MRKNYKYPNGTIEDLRVRNVLEDDKELWVKIKNYGFPTLVRAVYEDSTGKKYIRVEQFLYSLDYYKDIGCDISYSKI